MKKIGVAVVLLLASCVSVSPHRDVAGNYESFAQPKMRVLTFPLLVDILKTNRVATIADMLKILNRDYPDFLKMRATMYNSGSLQSATFNEPRG